MAQGQHIGAESGWTAKILLLQSESIYHLRQLTNQYGHLVTTGLRSIWSILVLLSELCTSVQF
jgi:hypothetical protein